MNDNLTNTQLTACEDALFKARALHKAYSASFYCCMNATEEDLDAVLATQADIVELNNHRAILQTRRTMYNCYSLRLKDLVAKYTR